MNQINRHFSDRNVDSICNYPTLYMGKSSYKIIQFLDWTSTSMKDFLEFSLRLFFQKGRKINIITIVKSKVWSKYCIIFRVHRIAMDSWQRFEPKPIGCVLCHTSVIWSMQYNMPAYLRQEYHSYPQPRRLQSPRILSF